MTTALRGLGLVSFVVMVTMATPTHLAVQSSYSHWCPAIEMTRVSCVVKYTEKNSPSANVPARSTLRRVYRWKKQFVLRCCPGFMGPNCQRACFSCKGFAAMTQRLNQVERIIKVVYNGQPTTTPMTSLRTEAPNHHDNGKEQQYPRVDRRQERLLSQTEAASEARRLNARSFRESESSARFKYVGRPKLEKPPGQMSATLDWRGADDTLNNPQMDQRRREPLPEAEGQGSGDRSGSSSGSGNNHASQSGERKAYPTQTTTVFPDAPTVTVVDGTTATVDAKSLWGHWDDEFQARLSTLERKVLELESKVSALTPPLTSVTSLTDQIDKLGQRLASLETRHQQEVTSPDESPSPCPHSCQGRKMPSPPPPPPLPDKQILERMFTNDSDLANALDKGYENFHQQLKAALSFRQTKGSLNSSSATNNNTKTERNPATKETHTEFPQHNSSSSDQFEVMPIKAVNSSTSREHKLNFNETKSRRGVIWSFGESPQDSGRRQNKGSTRSADGNLISHALRRRQISGNHGNQSSASVVLSFIFCVLLTMTFMNGNHLHY